MKVFALGLLAAVGITFSAHADSLPYADKDFACITQAQADRYVSDFNIDVDSYGGKELCNSAVDSKKLFNDLQIIEQGRFSESGSNLLIKGFIPANDYYSWMKSQTRGMNRGNDIPYATAYNRMGYFTMQDGWAKMSTLGRVGTVVHEARHTAGYSHYPCDHGPYAGADLAGCDTSYAEQGSHAIEMEYYARVTTMGQNFHPVYKSMARLMAMARANFVFNQSPIQAREAVVALDADTHAPVLFDHSQKFTREPSDFQGQLKRTSFGAALFNGTQTVALDLYQDSGFHQNNEDEYSYFKLLSIKGLGPLKDLEEYDQNDKRFVVAVTPSNQLYTFDFPTGSWNQPAALTVDVKKTATALPSGERGYFLIGANGEIYSVDPISQQTQAVNSKWDPSWVHVAFMNNQSLVLKTDGVIYQNGQRFDNGTYSDMINVPMYDAFEVK